MQNQRNIAQAKKSTFTNQLTPTTPNRHSFSVCVSSKSSVCFVFVFRLSQHAKAVVGSTKTAGRTQNLPLRADASGALQSKLQSSGAERHLAPRGVAATRATRRVAVSQLTTQFPSTPVFVRAPREIISDKLIVYRFDFLLRRGARGLERTGLRPARPRLRRGGAPTGRFISLAGEKQSLPARLGKFFRFNSSLKQSISLFRRSARGPLGTRTGPAGCNLHGPRAGGNRPNNSRLFDRFPTPAVARGRAIPTSWNCPYAGRAVPPGTR